jgi:hypothetical protein
MRAVAALLAVALGVGAVCAQSGARYLWNADSELTPADLPHSVALDEVILLTSVRAHRSV